MLTDGSNKQRTRIVLDAMGGDFAPLNVVEGAVEALSINNDIDLFLIGVKEQILQILKEKNLSFDINNIIDAPEVIHMDDSPTDAIREKLNSSIVLGAKMVKEGKADAFVSAGNTGAVHAASTLYIGRVKGISRATIGTTMPNVYGPCTIFDAGANVDAKARFLAEFAIMGSIFTKEFFGIDNPSVGLLSIGEEDSKGNAVSLEAFQLLKQMNLNFVGNVEGRDILNGNINVVVCDGFVGNIILKFGEGVLSFLKSKFSSFANESLMNKLKMGLVKSSMKKILKDFDYQEFGGVPLLGINGVSIIGHGKSTPKAIKNMVLKAHQTHLKNLPQKIESSIQLYSKLLH